MCGKSFLFTQPAVSAAVAAGAGSSQKGPHKRILNLKFAHGPPLSMAPELLLVSPSTHKLLTAAPSHGTVTFWVVPVARWCWDPPRAEHGIRDTSMG